MIFHTVHVNNETAIQEALSTNFICVPLQMPNKQPFALSRLIDLHLRLSH